jgi:CheY-like chemotaxis protein/archaellum biogenesis ATPase FlaH
VPPLTGRTAPRALLDEVVGGVVPGLPIALCGPMGSGRTVLCIEQVYGALARSEVAVFLTAEPGRLLLQQAHSLGLAFEEFLRSRRLRLLELEPDAPVALRTHGGEALARAILAAAPGARLAVVDPFTALTSDLLDEGEMRAAVRGLFEPLAAADCAVVVTVELEALEERPALARAIKDGCGIFAELAMSGDDERNLRVAKSRTGRCAERPVIFRVGPRGPARQGQEPRARGASTARDSSLPSSGEGASALPAPARILVVEDEGVTRAMLRDWLSPLYQVEEARDGFAAVSAVFERQPDLVLLDLHLPRASGYEVLRVLRAAGVTRPVLVVSGHLARASDRIRVLVLGATDLIAKPVHRFELLHKVEALLRYDPAPSPVAARGDAEVLLGEESPRRTLDEPAFRERLARALQFGDEFGLPSTLVAVRAPSADTLDAFIGAAETHLRPEDAVLTVSKSSALLLLVACPLDQAAPVARRLARALAQSMPTPPGLRFRACEARARGRDEDWTDLFRELQPWPPERGS